MSLYAPIAVVILLALVGAYFKGHSNGAESRNPEIASYQAAIATSEALAREAEARAKEVGQREVVKFRDRVKTIREEIPGQIQLVEVIKRESDPNCLLSPTFRLLHDSAATGSPVPENPAGVDGAAVPPQDLAATVADNYRTARENAERLKALQSYLSQIDEATAGNDHGKN